MRRVILLFRSPFRLTPPPNPLPDGEEGLVSSSGFLETSRLETSANSPSPSGRGLGGGVNRKGEAHVTRLRTALILIILSLLNTRPAAAQAAPPPDTPQGRFRPTTALVGQLLNYELTFDHDPALEVVFPDSLADFAPFEYVGQTYDPTRTRAGRSRDRAVYRLRTFALDAVQTLALPVLVLRGPADTLRLRPAPARLRLRRTVPPVPARRAARPPVLESDDRLPAIAPAFNYPFWLAGLAGLLLLGAGAATLFRARLRRRYAAYKRRKNHTYFLAQFARHVERFTLSQSATNVERAVTLWKNYLASLETSALSSFTTREMVAFFDDDDDVRRALQTTDRVVYGTLTSDDADDVELAFERLRGFAERRYLLNYEL